MNFFKVVKIGISWSGLVFSSFVLSIAQGNRPYGDITFLHITDVHYGSGITIDVTRNTVDVMNDLPGSNYVNNAGGGIIDEPRGIIVTGDLTEGTEAAAWASYQQDFDPEATSRLNYPAYETWGNHDDSGPLVQNGLRARIPNLPNLARVDESGLNYSWDWDNVHFVSLGLYPANTNQTFNSLDFLVEDLAAEVGTSGRPVVLMHHYDFDEGGGRVWWPEEDKEAAYEAVQGYNVIAWLVGHQHTVRHIQYRPAGSNGPYIDVYNAGTAKGATLNGGGPFLLFHITEEELVVVRYNNGTPQNQVWSKPIENNGIVSTNKVRPVRNVSFENRVLNLYHFGKATITLRDIQGREVFKAEAIGSKFEFSTETVSNGLYNWSVEMEDEAGIQQRYTGRVALLD